MNLLYPFLLGKAWLENAWARTHMEAPDTLWMPRAEDNAQATLPVPLAALPDPGARLAP
jgi:hypothetical protein